MGKIGTLISCQSKNPKPTVLKFVTVNYIGKATVKPNLVKIHSGQMGEISHFCDLICLFL